MEVIIMDEATIPKKIIFNNNPFLSSTPSPTNIKSYQKRSKYRYYIGWLWKLIGRCKHCGSNDLQKWDDMHLSSLSYNHVGYLCNKCGYITLRNI